MRSTQYINSLPSEPPGLQHFCMDNLLFASATTRVIYELAKENSFFILDNKDVKISREEVFAIDYCVSKMIGEDNFLGNLTSFVNHLFSKEAKYFK